MGYPVAAPDAKKPAPVIFALGQKIEDVNIENIINAIRSSRVRITDHADEEAFDDSLTYEEIYSFGYSRRNH